MKYKWLFCRKKNPLQSLGSGAEATERYGKPLQEAFFAGRVEKCYQKVHERAT